MENAWKQGQVTGVSQRDESLWEQQPPENRERRAAQGQKGTAGNTDTTPYQNKNSSPTVPCSL